MNDGQVRRRVSPAAFAFGLVMFAFPFVTVSCGGAPLVDLSGFQLAFGTEFQGEPVGPYGTVTLALFCAAAGAIAAWLAYRMAAVVLGAVGTASLLFFLFQFYVEIMQNPDADGTVGVISRVGFWLAVGALFAGALAAWYWFPQGRRESAGVGYGIEPEA